MLTKISSIFLAIFLLVQSFNFHSGDYLKLGALISHLEFHQDEYGDDIFAFISKHYGDKKSSHDQEPEEREDHERLPFNHNICSDSGQIFLIDFDKSTYQLSANKLFSDTKFHYQNSYTILQNTDFFQPPKA